MRNCPFQHFQMKQGSTFRSDCEYVINMVLRTRKIFIQLLIDQWSACWVMSYFLNENVSRINRITFQRRKLVCEAESLGPELGARAVAATVMPAASLSTG